MRPMQALQQREHLLPRQDDGQPDGLFGALHAVQQSVHKHQAFGVPCKTEGVHRFS
jgi:hypothetical protein